MREVDELNDAVDHRVAERHDGIHAAEREAIDHLLQKYVHAILYGRALELRCDRAVALHPSGRVSSRALVAGRCGLCGVASLPGNPPRERARADVYILLRRR